jgi:hypothetical protein
VELFEAIRRDHRREGLSIRQLARRHARRDRLVMAVGCNGGAFLTYHKDVYSRLMALFFGAAMLCSAIVTYLLLRSPEAGKAPRSARSRPQGRGALAGSRAARRPSSADVCCGGRAGVMMAWRSIPRNAGVVVAARTDAGLLEMRLIEFLGLAV